MNVPRIATLLLCLALGAGAIGTCQAQDPAGPQAIVPIDLEPMHRLRFENAHVRFFDVQLPPGYQSLWHSHLRDGVFVNISSSPTEAQDLGLSAQRRAPRKPGETYFIDYGTKPKVHRVTNVGETVYRVTDAEILARCASRAPLPPVGSDTLVDNALVRVTRVHVEPGASLELSGGCGMLVSVSGGELLFTGPGGREEASLAPAGFRWRESNSPLPLANRAALPFEGVDIIVK